jgi:hypothetical protein
MESKSTSVWLVNESFYLQAASKTTDGFWTTAYHPFYIVNKENIDELGKMIIKSLGDSKVGIKSGELSEEGLDRKKFLSVLGVKSEKALMKTGKSLIVNTRDSEVSIVPYKFNGDYLQSEKDKVIESALDSSQLQQDVLKAFELMKA